jgi:hypothetical protein
MNIPEMTAIAKEHWKEHLSPFYNLLVEQGQLQEEAEASAELTRMEMDVLKMGGMTEAEAWEAAMQIFVLMPPSKLAQLMRDQS